jgi:hypothetical protein
MPLMFLPLIWFAGFMEMLTPQGPTPARIVAKAPTARPRYRDINAD